jgi:hypothetical protein
MLRLMVKHAGRICGKAEPSPCPRAMGEAAKRKNDFTGRCVRSGNRWCAKSRTSSGRERKKVVGGPRGTLIWAGRGTGGRRGTGDESRDPLARPARTAGRTEPARQRPGRRTTASSWRWTEIHPGETPLLASSDRAPRGPGYPGGPQGSSQVDIEKLDPHRERAEPGRLCGQ